MDCGSFLRRRLHDFALFIRIWVPSWENRDLRQLLWHRHRLVQARTRVMNQLQAVAINEGLRCKKRLWRQTGELDVALSAGRGGAGDDAPRAGMAQSILSLGDAEGAEDGQGGDGSPPSHWFVRSSGPKRRLGRTESCPENDYERAYGWKSNTIHESEMALFSECMPECARKGLDIADIVRDAMLRQ